MVRRIIWTERAKNELVEILEYWDRRNGSKRFSKKLVQLIRENLLLLTVYPKIGRKTNFSKIRVRTIQKYLVYYEYDGNFLYVVAIRHQRRNPNSLKLK